jgi:hypothetical protein
VGRVSPSLPGHLSQKSNWQGLKGSPVAIPFNGEGLEGTTLMCIPSIPSPQIQAIDKANHLVGLA